MKKSNATRHGTRRISRRRRKVRRFIRKVKPFFVLTIVGVTIAIMICKIIALAAPLREVTEETRSFGLDLTEVRRIHQEHQEAMQERNNASRDAAMQIAQGMGNREIGKPKLWQRCKQLQQYQLQWIASRLQAVQNLSQLWLLLQK